MLSYDEFQKYIVDHIKEVLTEEYQNADVNLCSVSKNNGKIFQALMVHLPESTISPRIYLEPFYAYYQKGEDLSYTLRKLADAAQSKCPADFENMGNQFYDFNYIKDKVIAVVVNAKANDKMLKKIPHTLTEDLAIIYKVLLTAESLDSTATITIQNKHLPLWEIDKEELHELAIKNSKEKLPMQIKSMREVLSDMTGDMFGMEDMANFPMYVISNKQCFNGASAIFYDEETFSQFAGEKDYFILPSSIHEVIAIPAEEHEVELLAEMVREVNGTQVSEEEKLSDHVYFYDAKAHSLSIADKHKTMQENITPEANMQNEAVRRTARAR